MFMYSVLQRKYYKQYSGYLGPALQRLAECLFNTGHLTEAATAIQVIIKDTTKQVKYF
jgi:hypothetical protein